MFRLFLENWLTINIWLQEDGQRVFNLFFPSFLFLFCLKEKIFWAKQVKHYGQRWLGVFLFDIFEKKEEKREDNINQNREGRTKVFFTSFFPFFNMNNIIRVHYLLFMCCWGSYLFFIASFILFCIILLHLMFNKRSNSFH